MIHHPQLSLDFKHHADLQPGQAVRVNGRIVRIGNKPGTYETLHGDPYVVCSNPRSVVRCPAYDRLEVGS